MKEVLKEYFLVRRWFLHHVLLGLLIGLIAGAAVMWFVTDRYFDDAVEANIGNAGTVGGTVDRVAPTSDPVVEPVDELDTTKANIGNAGTVGGTVDYTDTTKLESTTKSSLELKETSTKTRR